MIDEHILGMQICKLSESIKLLAEMVYRNRETPASEEKHLNAIRKNDEEIQRNSKWLIKSED